MPRKPPYTIGSNSFDPDRLLTDTELHKEIHSALNRNDLKSAIITAFGLSGRDTYEYRATTGVTLDRVQRAVEAGSANGLHGWYLRDQRHQQHQQHQQRGKPSNGTSMDANDDDNVGGGGSKATAASASTITSTSGNGSGSGSGTTGHEQVLVYPTRDEVMAYIKLFDPSKASANLLKALKANAKKNSLQADVAENLLSKRCLDGSDGSSSNGNAIVVPKSKKGHLNIYADIWAWSCLSLQWAGPTVDAAKSHTSHPVLIVAMHHFGCVCPSYESLEIVKCVSRGKTVLDVGSGNGYWSYMLRRHGVDVIPVDNGQSEWRTIWVGDTVKEDGVRFLNKRVKPGDDVLLLVYPVVGLDFTTSVLDAYKGDVVVVAGTQNENGYTGFKDETMDVWMRRERKEFEKVVQVPLPSFAGKDDALFVWRRKGKEKEMGNG